MTSASQLLKKTNSAFRVSLRAARIHPFLSFLPKMLRRSSSIAARANALSSHQSLAARAFSSAAAVREALRLERSMLMGEIILTDRCCFLLLCVHAWFGLL